MTQWLRFENLPHSGTTVVVLVRSVMDGKRLGEIRWYAPWRRYVLNPAPETVWDAACLREVRGHIQGLMDARRE
jgi:hypothetical protein